LWTEGRLSRTRLPRLKKAYENAPIYTFWLPPDAFAQALPVLSKETKPEEKLQTHRPGASYSPVLTWRNFAFTFGLLAVLMAAQVLSTRIWKPQIYSQAQMSQASVQLVMPDLRLVTRPAKDFAKRYAEKPTRLVLSDGETILYERPYPFAPEAGLEPLVLEFPMSVGEHNLTLSLVSDSDHTLPLYEQTVTLAPGQVCIILYDSRFKHEREKHDKDEIHSD
jgi:hypothetical protein